MKKEKLHYDQHTVNNPNKKSLAAYSNQVAAEDSCGVDVKFFKTNYVQDNDHTFTFFERLCKRWGLKNKEIQEMKKALLETGRYREDGRKRYFSDEDLWNTLISNEICKRFCEKRKIQNWPEIINYVYGI